MTNIRIIGPALALVASFACATPNKYTPPEAGADEGVGETPDASVTGDSAKAVDGPLTADVPSGPDAAPTDGPQPSTDTGPPPPDGPCGTPTDPRNCGTCGHDCTKLSNVVAAAVTCQAGKCVVPATACASGYGHCSANVEDGCEASLARQETCGACNTKCGPAELCAVAGGSYQCASSCSGGTPDKCTSTCTNLQTDSHNCGSCGHDCAQLANVKGGAPVSCQGGHCMIPASSCITGYGHCGSGPADNGCETNVSAPQTCGCSSCASGQVCVASGGSYQCMCSDCTAPTILSVSPVSGATGVRSDAKLVITFSEPMDRNNTESAFASSDISSRTFSWDGSGTILTITPTGGLQYASGSSPSVAARTYTFSVATSARDLAGNRLQQATSVSFTTLRRISMSTPGATEALSGTIADGQPPVFADGYAWVSCNNLERAFLTFDLTSLPSAIESFELATANWAYLPNLGPPAAKVEIAHLAFTSPSTQLFDSAATTVGTLSTPQGRTTTFSGSQLVDAVSNDYQTRTGSDRRTQYRMRLLSCSGTDGGSFSLEESKIALTFLIK